MKVIDRKLKILKLSQFIRGSCNKDEKALRYCIDINTKTILVYEMDIYIMYFISNFQ
jgi:hypothetical protein